MTRRSPMWARRTAERRGRRAEWLAAALLSVKGYRILALRHRNAAGEIDLIARKGRLIAYVEVKYRARKDTAPFAVTERQRHRIRRVAGLFLAQNPGLAGFDQRFDVLIMSRLSLPQHIKNAW